MILKRTILLIILISSLTSLAVFIAPRLQEQANITPPQTVYADSKDNNSIVIPCPNEHPEWRVAQVIDSVTIEAAPACEPDNPYDIATSVK